MLAPTSPGDVLDRLTILALKVARVADPHKVAVAQAHRDALLDAWGAAHLPPIDSLPEHASLAAVNAALWDVEEQLRAAERAQRFDDRFIALARSVYTLNDRRSALKSTVDRQFQSTFTDVKSYST